MMGIIFLAVIAVLVVVALCYLIVMLASGFKTGRQADVKVLSCEQKGEAENRLYYEMKVEFYDANGEVLVRTMQSGKKYMPGDMVRCRYLEKTGLLLEEMAPEVRIKSRNNVLLFLVIFLIFAGVVAAVITGKGLPDKADRLIIYFISILFMAVGVFGIYNKIQMKQKMQVMIPLPGIQVDYTISRDTDTRGRKILIYKPVYEYEWGGERRRIAGPVGSSGKRYRAIGKEVHILLDPHTEKAVCQEDEKTKVNVYLLFGIIGLVVLVLLLAQRYGVLS